MKKSIRLLLMTMMAGAALSVSVAQAQQSSAPSPASGAAPVVADANNHDSDFGTEAANAGIMEVETSKVAAQKTKDPKVKSFAKMMVSDHTKANQKLQKLAKDKGMTLPDDQAAKAETAKLQGKRGHDLDIAYLQAAGPDAHQKVIALFEQEASSGQDTQMRSFAKQTLPTLKKHLKAAQDVQARVEKQK